jgi:glycerol-3-phosphate dehydrogenase
VSRERVVADLFNAETANLDDVRRTARLGMGPCQGGFCTYRAAALMHEVRGTDPVAVNGGLRHFLQERWRGLVPVAQGDQVRQAQLDRLIYLALFNTDHLPTTASGDLVTDETLYMSPDQLPEGSPAWAQSS